MGGGDCEQGEAREEEGKGCLLRLWSLVGCCVEIVVTRDLGFLLAPRLRTESLRHRAAGTWEAVGAVLAQGSSRSCRKYSMPVAGLNHSWGWTIP